MVRCKKCGVRVRSQEELELFLRSALRLHDGSLRLYSNGDEAKRHTIEQYYDLRDWVYGFGEWAAEEDSRRGAG